MIFNSFSEIFEYRKNSELPALLFDFSGSKMFITYQRFYFEVMRLAEKAKKQNISRELVVCSNDEKTVIRIFADIIAGIDVVTADKTLSEDALSEIFTASKCDSVFAVDYEQRKSLLPKLYKSSENIKKEKKENNKARLVFFTSTANGNPRGAVISQKALLSASDCLQDSVHAGENDIILSSLPVSHAFGFVCAILWGLCSGSCIALSKNISDEKNPNYFRPTILPASPAALKKLIKTDGFNDNLKTVIVAASLLPKNIASELKDRDINLKIVYGMTELSGIAAASCLEDDPYRLKACGNNKIEFEGDGEIKVKSDNLMDCYIDGTMPTDKDGYFLTGDIGEKYFDGSFKFKCSKKDIIILSDGTKIHCEEYEEKLRNILSSDELCIIDQNGSPALVVSDKIDMIAAISAVKKLNGTLSKNGQIKAAVSFHGVLPRDETGRIQKWKLS